MANFNPLHAIILAFIALTIGGWTISAMLGRLDRELVWLGLRRGLVVAILVGAGVGTVIFLATVGQPSMFGGFTVPLSLFLGASVGLVAAIAYLWIVAILLPIGFVLRGGRRWASVWVLVAAPLAGLLAFSGYALSNMLAFSAVYPEPVARPGTISLEIQGPRIGQVRASGEATCLEYPSGAIGVSTGYGDDGSPYTTADGRTAYLEVGWDGEGVFAQVAIGVAGLATERGHGWEAGPDTTAVVPGSTYEAGSIGLAGIVPIGFDGRPMEQEIWVGSAAWQRPAG